MKHGKKLTEYKDTNDKTVQSGNSTEWKNGCHENVVFSRFHVSIAEAAKAEKF